MENLNYVIDFVNDALKYALDKNTPLFADEYYRQSKQQVCKNFDGTPNVIKSNLARQMNFIRTLYALSALTEDDIYKEKANAAIHYHFEHHQYRNGLIDWGGHRVVNLRTHKCVGEHVHELKNNFLSYMIMNKVDEERTKKYMRAFWNAHVYNWKTLEISRHGDFFKPMGVLWNNNFENPEPFFEALGLSFLNAGIDLIYTAFELYKITNEEGALIWGKRLAEMYVKARNKKTGLGVYQFTQPKQRQTTDDFSITYSIYGDRAKRQLGPELGTFALEGNVLLEAHANTIYGISILTELKEAETVPNKELRGLINDCTSGLLAYAKYGYIKETKMFKPLLADGQDLTGFILQRDGYYGQKGESLGQYKASGTIFLAFLKTALISTNKELLEVAESIGESLDLGPKLINLKTKNSCPEVLFAYINLYQYTNDNIYLQMAETISKNICNLGFDDDIIKIDSLNILALLCIEAAKRNMLDSIDFSIYI